MPSIQCSSSSNKHSSSTHHQHQMDTAEARQAKPEDERPQAKQDKAMEVGCDEMQLQIVPVLPLRHGCDDFWTWNRYDKSTEVKLYQKSFRIAYFHPNWSSGTAGVRGTRVLNNGRYYWELELSQRVFGTSIMFGVGTRRARLHADIFTNLLGEDSNGWGLSHKGLAWHAGRWHHYAKPFHENKATTVGILFDGVAGTVTYYKDGNCLGVAFRGLNDIKEPLYPIVCSTAAKTAMALGRMKRDFVNLQDRCRAVIVKRIKSREHLKQLYLPSRIESYLGETYVEEIPCQETKENGQQQISMHSMF